MTDAAELERLLGEYYAREGSETPEEFIARHPEHAELLREHLELDDLVGHAFGAAPALPERLGPFRIEKELGTGGMGTVYRAVVTGPMRGIANGRTVALKVVHPHLFRTPGFFKRFLREAELGRRIEHANVVHTLDADAVEVDDRPQHYLVMEYVEGQTLRELVEDVDRVPEELARHIGCEVAKALSAIHAAGAVHRDLKPENVLITKDHEVKVMDLGVARLADEQMRLSQTGAFVGSLHYAAPEQFGGGADVDYRADLHGLGLLLYEIATGSHPYADEDARVVMRRILSEAPRKAGELNTQLSPFFEECVARLLEKDPAARFGSADALLDVLEYAEQSAWWRARAKELRTTSKRPLRRIRVPRETALYGRDAELEQLHALYDEAKSGEGRVVLIEGEAGIGKTRLVDEFVSRLQQSGEDLDFVFAGYPPGGAATASGAFCTAYREHLGEERLEDALTGLLPQTPILVPALAALLRGDAAPKDSEPLTKGSLQTCFVHLTRNLAAERTTIVLIDDLHFAPVEGRALFTSVALAVPGHRILLLGTMRPGVPEEWTAGVTRLEQTTHVTIPRLGPKELVRLLGDSFRSQRLAEELGGKIAVKSDGNPFFVFEIIRGLREGQFITQREDGSWHTTRLIEDIQVPSSVLDLVNVRVADLDDDDRNLLDVAACWGYEFDPSLIGAALGLPRLPVLQRLAKIEKRDRLVRSAGRNYIFDHHQVQEALYESLNEQLCEEYHAALAEALEARSLAQEGAPEELDGTLCAELCVHFLRSSVPKRCVGYLHSALDYLAGHHLNQDGVDLIDRALAIDGLVNDRETVRLLLQKAQHLDTVGHRDGQRVACEAALALARKVEDRELEASALGSLGMLAFSCARYDEALDLSTQTLRMVREMGDRRAEITRLANVGRALGPLGRQSEAKEHLEQALALARTLGDRLAESSVVGSLGNTLAELGLYRDALRAYERQLALARDEDRIGETAATINIGTIHKDLGQYDDARGFQERGLELARQIGHRRYEANALGNIAISLDLAGRRERAVAMLERRMLLSREIGDVHGEGTASNNLGLCLLACGRLSQAVEAFRRSIVIHQGTGTKVSEAIATGNCGDALLCLGRHAEARDHLERALAAARAASNPHVQGYWIEALARLAAQMSDSAAAERLFEEAIQLRRSVGEKVLVAESLCARGSFRARAGESDRAATDLRDALRIAEDLPVHDVVVRANSHLACLPGGDPEGAQDTLAAFENRCKWRTTMEARWLLWRARLDATNLAEAHRLLQFLRDHAPEEYRDTMVENVPLHRDIVAAWAEHGGAAG